MKRVGKYVGKEVYLVNKDEYRPLESDYLQLVMINTKNGYLMTDDYYAVGLVQKDDQRYVIDDIGAKCIKEIFIPKEKKVEVETKVIEDWKPDTSIVDKFFEELGSVI